MSGSFDKKVKIWNSTNNIVTLTGHFGAILTIIQLADGKLVSGSADHNIRIWDLTTYNAIISMNEHTSDVTSVIQLNDGLLASASADKTIKFFNVTSRKLEGSIAGDNNSSIVSLVLLSEGKIISSSAQFINIWKKNY